MARVLTLVRRAKKLAIVTVPLAALIYATPVLAVGPIPPPLGLAGGFAALGGTGVTCTAPNPPLPAVTISGGDVGSGTVAGSITGFPNLCTTSGAIRPAQTAAMGAMRTAYTTLAGSTYPCPSAIASHNLSGNIGGRNLGPGVYCMTGVILLTSQLTLAGGASDTWIFKSADGTTSITPIGGSVVMAGGASACNVYWQLATTAIFNNTSFAGNVLAGTAITLNGTNSSLAGRALAQSLVSMTGAHIVSCGSAAGGGGGGGDGGGGDDQDGNGGGDDHHDGGDGEDHHGDGGDKHHGDGEGEHHGSGGSHGD